MSTARPPQFLLWEVVRIAEVTGRELNGHDKLFDAAPLLGEHAVVVGAVPNRNRDGWLVHGWVDSLGDIASFPEEALVSTGLEDVRDGPGPGRRGPLDVGRRWRDDVVVDLRTGPLDDAEVDAVARQAAAALARVEGVDEVDWELVAGVPAADRWITLWARSDGDALQAFGRIVALTRKSWEHRAAPLILSHWKPRRGSEFLVPEATRASVTYRCMTAPERRSRSEIARP